MTPLHIAIENDDVEMVKLLLSNEKIDINAKAILHFLFVNNILKPFFIIFKINSFLDEILKRLIFQMKF